MARHALQKIHDGGVAAIGQEGVIPDVDDVLLGDRLHVAEINEHAPGRRAFGLDELAGQGDFQRVAVAVEVTALAGVGKQG